MLRSTSSLRTATAALALATLSTLGVACAARSGSVASDTSGAEDVAGTESDVEALGTSFVGSDGASVATQALPGGGGLTVQGLATGGNPGFWFEPAGCLQVTTDAATQSATYVFDGCTGPLGLVELNGTVNVSWQSAAGQLTVDFSATGFHVNRATIDSWQATAVVTASGPQRTMTWNAQLSGTTRRGRAFDRTNQKTVVWTVGVPCLDVSGESTGDILGAHLQTTIATWRRCADACPEAGSEIDVKNLDKGNAIEIQYQGGPSAELTIDGHSEEIALTCAD
jgi:hypothetical protein